MTIHTITDEQIETLSAEASAAGDLDQMYICLRALGQVLAPVNHDGGPAMAMSIDEAREECAGARVIRDAAAMIDAEPDTDDGRDMTPPYEP